jgi:hypothetical protein
MIKFPLRIIGILSTNFRYFNELQIDNTCVDWTKIVLAEVGQKTLRHGVEGHIA